MAIEINENVLLTIAGIIFVPIFVFLIKMIMEVANMRTKIDSFNSYMDESKGAMKKLADLGYEVRAMKTALADIDGDLKYLFHSVHHDVGVDKSGDEQERFGSRRQFRQSGIKGVDEKKDE